MPEIMWERGMHSGEIGAGASAGRRMNGSMSLTQERWLATSRWARFGLCLAPLLAAFVVLEVLAYGALASLDEQDQEGLAIILFYIMVVALPAALLGGVITAIVLVLTDSRRGIGFTMLGALGGATLITAVPLLQNSLT